jgi:hypothetical protein
VKCLDPEGAPLWAVRLTEGINEHELLGTLVLEIETPKHDLVADWADED